VILTHAKMVLHVLAVKVQLHATARRVGKEQLVTKALMIARFRLLMV